MVVSVLVVVLGDIGHSPRMVRHIRELLRTGHAVDCVGYQESEVPEALPSFRFAFHPIPVLPSARGGAVYAIVKVVVQTLLLVWALFRIRARPTVILSQNPPSLPLSFILPVVAWVYGARWVIDWHNTSHSLLQLQYGQGHWIVAVARWMEYGFGRMADNHLCVTRAMREDLIRRGYSESRVTVCYDHPSQQLRKIRVAETHELFRRLMKQIPGLSASVPGLGVYNYTPLTVWDEVASYRGDRPALIVSSTSWTADEDFDMLFEAIDRVEQGDGKGLLPKVILVITGKGPLKDQFVEKCRAREKTWARFSVFFAWLDYQDYQKLLGCADLGISMHFSSSGLDFPMKIVDMVGAGLPVLSIEFPCAFEVICPRINGLLFRTSQELAQELVRLLSGFPNNEELLELQRRCERETFWKESWSEHWQSNVKPALFKERARRSLGTRAGLCCLAALGLAYIKWASA